MITCALVTCDNPVRSKKHKYCCHQCSVRARVPNRGVCQIPGCGNPLRKGQKSFCSRACANKAGHTNIAHPEEIRQEVFRLWLERKDLSAADIGREVGGLSKHAVIGLIHRGGLPGRASPIGNTDPQAAASRIEKSRIALMARIAERQQVRAMTDVQIQQLRQRPRFKAEPKPPQPQALAVFSIFKTCQWVEEEGSAVKPWIFCEAPTKPGTPYCHAHAKICYTKRAGFGYENPEKAVAAVGAAA